MLPLKKTTLRTVHKFRRYDATVSTLIDINLETFYLEYNKVEILLIILGVYFLTSDAKREVSLLIYFLLKVFN